MFYPEPKQLDIVYGLFPYCENPKNQGKKPHYCLILDVLKDEDGNPWVIVAFGTSANWNVAKPGEFRVQPTDPSGFSETGLQKPTKFCLRRDRLAKLPYNDEWFDIPPERRSSGTTPKIGVLSHSAYGQVLKNAGLAVDIRSSLAELERVDLGSLS